MVHDNPGPGDPRFQQQAMSNNTRQFNPFPASPNTQLFPPTGGGGSHDHTFTVTSSSLGGTISMPNMNVKYANVIIANKD